MLGKEGATPVALEEEVVVVLFADTRVGDKAKPKASKTRLSVSIVLLNIICKIVSRRIDGCVGRRSVRSSHCDNGVQRAKSTLLRAAAARLIDGRLGGRVPPSAVWLCVSARVAIKHFCFMSC